MGSRAKSRRIVGLAIFVSVLLLVWIYRSSFVAILEKWETDAAFSRGYLVLPIVLWLVWRKRGDLRAVSLAPSWTGAFVVAVLLERMETLLR